MFFWYLLYYLYCYISLVLLPFFILSYLLMETTHTFPVLTEKTLQIECTVIYEQGNSANSSRRLEEDDIIKHIDFGITVYMNGTIKKTMFSSWISKESVRDTISWLLRMFSDFDYTNVREDSKRWNEVLDNLYNTLCIKREEKELPYND